MLLERRRFLRLAALTAGGAFTASQVPLWFLELFPDNNNWETERIADLTIMLRPNLHNRTIDFKIYLPSGNMFELSVSYEGNSPPVPRRFLFAASKHLLAQAAAEGSDNSTGHLNRVLASFFPFHLAARKLSSIDRTNALTAISPNDTIDVTWQENNSNGPIETFDWKLSDQYGGKGYVAKFNPSGALIHYDYRTEGDNRVLGKKPQNWLEGYTNKIVRVAGQYDYCQISLAHPCPSVWIYDHPSVQLAIANLYANAPTFTYYDTVLANRDLSNWERNTFATTTPNIAYSDQVSPVEAEEIIARIEKGAAFWKSRYPHLTFGTDSLVFDQANQSFHFVPRSSVQNTVLSLREGQLWFTPGEVFVNQQHLQYRGVSRAVDQYFDITANGLIIVPDGDNKFIPWGMLSTEQIKYLSLFQVEQIFQMVCKQYNLPLGSVLVNGDKHGAGGLCYTI